MTLFGINKVIIHYKLSTPPLPVMTSLFVTLLQAITKELFDEALRALADEDYLTVTGKTVRLLA